MGVGLEVINAHGTIQISADSVSLGCIGRYNPSSYISNGFYFDIGLQHEIPMVAVSSGPWCSQSYMQNTGASRRLYFNTSVGSPIAMPERAVYMFDRISATGGKAGLQVFDRNGRLCFDATQLPGRIVEVLTGGQGVLTLTPGRKYAVATASARNRGVFGVEDGLLFSTYYQSQFRVDGHVIHYDSDRQIAANSVPYPGSTPANYSNGSPIYLVLDVTGYFP